MNIIFQGGSHQIFYVNSIIILINQAYEAAGLLEFNKLERKIAERLGNFAVTPCVGVWIEMQNELQTVAITLSHSLCGSVD